jgi:hypothetical protein
MKKKEYVMHRKSKKIYKIVTLAESGVAALECLETGIKIQGDIHFVRNPNRQDNKDFVYVDAGVEVLETYPIF